MTVVLLILAIGSFVAFMYLTKRFSDAGIKTFLVVGALCLIPLVFISVGNVIDDAKRANEPPPYSIGKDPTRLQMKPPDSQSTTTPAPKPEPATTPTPPPAPAPQPEPSLTVEEFDKRFLDRLNVAAQTLGVDPAESMGTPEHRGNILVYQISTTAHMEENVTASGGLRGVNLITHNLDGDTIRSTLVFFFCAAEAFDPTVDINAVIGALALDPNSPDVVKPKITTINGVTYEKKFVDKKSLILTVKQ